MKCLFLALLCFSSLLAEECRTFFVSPLRTGTHLICYSVQWMAGRHVHFWYPFHSKEPIVAPDTSYFGAPLDTSKSVILHTHYPMRHLREYSKEDNTMFMTLRNPKEYLLRRAKERLTDPEKICEWISRPRIINGYMKYLEFYESWNPKKRHIVYYEDLMTDFESTMRNLLHFIGEPITASFHRYMKSYKWHNERLLKHYHKNQGREGGSMSKGTDISFHSRDIPKKTLLKIDTHIETHFPEYWERYLKRYKER